MDKFDDVCEHVSRDARYELVELLLENLGSPAMMAAQLGITEMAVRKWFYRLTHPSNVHLQKILELAFKVDKLQASKIVKRDLLKHQTNFSHILK